MVWKGREDQRNELLVFLYSANCQYFQLSFGADFFFHIMISRTDPCPLSCAELRLPTVLTLLVACQDLVLQSQGPPSPPSWLQSYRSE